MSTDSSFPFFPLLPVVKILEEHGNLAVDGGFLNSPSGWYCRMRDPLDVHLIRAAGNAPPNWDVSEEGDTVLDRNTWCAILGPGADGYG